MCRWRAVSAALASPPSAGFRLAQREAVQLGGESLVEYTHVRLRLRVFDSGGASGDRGIGAAEFTRSNISWFFSTSTRCTFGIVVFRKATDFVPTCTVTFLPSRSAGVLIDVSFLRTTTTRPPL